MAEQEDKYADEKAAAKIRAMNDLINYTTLWVRKHDGDPEFDKRLTGKNLQEMIPMLNARYRCALDPNHVRGSDYLFDLANAIGRWKDARVASNHRKDRREKMNEKAKATAERVQAQEAKAKAAEDGEEKVDDERADRRRRNLRRRRRDFNAPS